MKTKAQKKSIVIGIISTAVLLLLAAGIALFWQGSEKDSISPAALLETAATRTEKNLCRLALLEEEPANEAVWADLLADYSVHADPITYRTACQKAKSDLGARPVFTEGTSAPQITAPLAEGSTLAQKGYTMTEFKDASGICVSKNTVYFCTEEGIFASYQGLTRKISPAIAQGMIAAEEGLYFLNLTQRKVQYLAGDGSFTATLSTVKTSDFTYIQGILWVLGTDGTLYRDGTPLETPRFREIAAVGTTLYAKGTDGLYRVEQDGTSSLLLSKVITTLTSGEDGFLYFLNEEGYPYRFDPATEEAAMIKNVSSVAVGQTNDTVYVYTAKGKLRIL